MLKLASRAGTKFKGGLSLNPSFSKSIASLKMLTKEGRVLFPVVDHEKEIVREARFHIEEIDCWSSLAHSFRSVQIDHVGNKIG